MSADPEARTIVVTGANGFIGGHLARRLAGSPHRAVLVGRRVPPGAAAGWVSADLARPGWTTALPDRADVVIHLAQSRRFREFPAGAPDVFAVNVQATAELLDWSTRAGVAHFVLASTGSVYGEQLRPLREDDPCTAVGFYPASKYAAELLTAPYGSLFATTALRLFGPYGPGQEGMLVSNILEKVRTGGEIQLARGIGIHMSPLYVDDAVDAILRVALDAAAAGHRTFNLAGGDVVTLGALVAEASRALGTEANVVATDQPPRWVAADIARFRDAYRWSPAVPLAEGIRRTVGVVGAPSAAAGEPPFAVIPSEAAQRPTRDLASRESGHSAGTPDSSLRPE
jgi:nucleoside-diphosphate-sugar epimerase